MTKIEKLPEFKKDVKSLKKRFRTIEEDLAIVAQVLNVDARARPPFSFPINNLGLETCIIKIRKMACKSLKGKGAMSGLRLVYAHFEEEDRIVFVELYYKSDKANEDKERIFRNFG